MKVVGMISGTSYDAVDAAVGDFELDADTIRLRPLGLHSHDISGGVRERIAALLPPATTTIETVCRLDTELGQLFGRVAAEAADAHGGAELVSSHGQTVFHWVDGPRALGDLQLGSPAWIVAATGLPVVSDLRNADIVRGGQGAPLASTLDALLLAGRPGRCGSLNLGGIANVTVLDPTDPEAVVAYDLGPANALMDAAVVRRTDGRDRLDRDGARGRAGRVDADVLRRLLGEPYYRLPAPKSTGKELFHPGYLDAPELVALSDDDLVATLTELTAELVAAAVREHRLDELVVAGGGIRNPYLMERIAALCAGCTVRPIDDFGLPAQAKEAYLFGLLGFLTWNGLPGIVPSATGASDAAVLGSITPGTEPLRLPAPATVRPVRLEVVT